jgi:coenzyme F420-reducing hydrogenase delta subunit
MSKTAEAQNGKPRIVVLYCQHSIKDDVDVTACARKVERARVRPAMMPCSSKVQVSHLLDILDQEADGVEVIACPTECCGHLIGSKRAAKRVEYTRRLLDQIGVEPERLGISYGVGLSSNAFLTRVAGRSDAVLNLGKNGDDQ